MVAEILQSEHFPKKVFDLENKFIFLPPCENTPSLLHVRRGWVNGQLGVQEVEWLLVDEHAGVRVLLEEALVAAEMRLQTLVVGSGHRGRGRWVALL